MKVKSVKLSHSVVSDSLRPPWRAHQAPPSMGFSRQEYWSGLPFPFPGDLPDPVVEPRSPAFQADTLPSDPPVKMKEVGIRPKGMEEGYERRPWVLQNF